MADEGVEFFLEINAQLDEATKMIRELTKVQSAALRAGKSLGEVEKKTGSFGRSMKTAAGAVGTFAKDTLAHFVALASFEGLKRLGEGLFDLGREAFTAAGEAERTRESFRLLMGVPVADELLEYLDDLAKHTEFTDGALKGFAGELSSAGLSGESLKKALAAVTDIAALTGSKVEGAAKAVALLSKMSLKGEVSTRELLGAKIDPRAFFAQVAKDTGIGMDKVEKAISENKVPGNVLRGALFETIQKKTGQDLGGASVLMSKTALAQADKVKDIIPNLMEELEKSGGLKGITLGMSKLVAAFDPSSAAGQRLVKSITEMFDKIGAGIAKIDFDKLSKTLTDLFSKLPGLIEGTTKAGLRFLEFLSKIGGTKDAAAVTMSGKPLAATKPKGSLVEEAFNVGAMPMMNSSLGRGAKPIVANVPKPNPDDWSWLPSSVGNLMRVRDQQAYDISQAAKAAEAPPPPPPPPATPARPGMGPGAALLQAKPNQTFAANVTVNVNGVPDDDAGRAQLGEQLGANARRQVESLLERLAAEGAAT
jgi:hypothetical protein